MCTASAQDAWPAPGALRGSPASLLLLHVLDDGTLGECQLVLPLRFVVEESFDGALWERSPGPADRLPAPPLPPTAACAPTFMTALPRAKGTGEPGLLEGSSSGFEGTSQAPTLGPRSQTGKLGWEVLSASSKTGMARGVAGTPSFRISEVGEGIWSLLLRKNKEKGPDPHPLETKAQRGRSACLTKLRSSQCAPPPTCCHQGGNRGCPGEESGRVSADPWDSGWGQPRESCGHTPTTHFATPLRPRKTTNTTSAQRPQAALHPTAGGPSPASCAQSPKLYLERGHGVRLHIEARVAALVQRAVVRLLETG